MNATQKVQLVMDRFIHRSDVFARQWYDENRGTGYYRVTEGQCTHEPPCPKRRCPDITNQGVSSDAILSHLKGEQTLGIYQLGEDNTVKWLCLDVDLKAGAEATDENIEDVRNHTKQLVNTFRAEFGERFPVLVEFSGSKGYHLWVFFDPPTQARFAYALAHYVDAKVAPKDHITTEIFPKQTTTVSFGNLMKLPLGLHKKTGERCFFVDDDLVPFENQWSALTDTKPMTDSQVQRVIEYRNIKPPMSIRSDTVGTVNIVPCMHNMIHEGIGHGARDIGAFRLACFFRSHSMTYEMTLAAMQEWNNTNAPPMQEETLTAKVDSAFRQDYSYLPCQEVALDPYCESSCRFFQRKLRSRWQKYGKPAKEAVGVISRG